jgi:23S rRNA U2552 (ribose-2'-O)-methylase RlmE/FtsJ
MNNEIKQLFQNAKNKSIKWEKYFDTYERLFKNYKNKKIIFVEIGIQNGGSLDIWSEYFSNDSTIIGIDINPECKKFERDNIKIFIGNQSDENFWIDFFNKVGKVDIILDDGGHTNLDQITTLVNCFKNINDQGLFVTEDTHTSYIKDYNSEKFNFSLNKHIYSVQFFESIVAFEIDKKKCCLNNLLSNSGQDSKINDLTWEGNEIKIKKIKNFLKNIPFLRFNKLTNFIKNKVNNKTIKKYFL